MTDTDTKPASASTTVWAGVFTIVTASLPALLAVLGFRTGHEQQAAIDSAAQLAAAIGGVLAVYGRLTATQRIG